MQQILQALRSRTVLLAIAQAAVGIVLVVLTEADMAGTASDPYLTVEHAAGAPSSIKSIDGVLKANIKSFNGVHDASVGSINGISNV